MIILRDEFARDLPGEDVFAAIFTLEGTVARAVEQRRTLDFRLGDHHYFAKMHFGVGWREIFKNLFQLRLPILGASNEWRALERLHELGVDTLTAVGYGERGLNPARRESFLVTEALEGTRSLEELAIDWQDAPPPPALKRRLLRQVATMTRLMHAGGVNHRDCYICHFLVDLETLDTPEPRIFLIDLHRAQLRSGTPFRWRAKDVGGLLYSAADAGLTVRDVYRFITAYTGQRLRDVLPGERRLWLAALDRATALYRRDHERVSPLLEALAERL